MRGLPRWHSYENPHANSGDAGDLGLILGGEDHLEEDSSPLPVFLAGIPWAEEPVAGYSPQSLGVGLYQDHETCWEYSTAEPRKRTDPKG